MDMIVRNRQGPLGNQDVWGSAVSNKRARQNIATDLKAHEDGCICKEGGGDKAGI